MKNYTPPFFEPLSLKNPYGDALYLIDDILPMRGTVFLHARSNVGKTFLNVSWAYSVAMSDNWLGYGVNRNGAVWYLASEDGAGVMQRIQASLEYHGHNLDSFLSDDPDRREKGLMDKLPVSVMNGVMLKITDRDDHGAFDERNLSKWIKDCQDSIGKGELERPALVIIDTIIKFFDGDNENSSTQTSSFTAGCQMIADGFECCVVSAGHDQKNGPRHRGSSALLDNVDLSYQLERLENQSEKIIKLNREKNRIGVCDFNLTLKLKQYEILNPRLAYPDRPAVSCVLALADSTETAMAEARKSASNGLSQKQKERIGILARYCEECGWNENGNENWICKESLSLYLEGNLKWSHQKVIDAFNKNYGLVGASIRDGWLSEIGIDSDGLEGYAIIEDSPLNTALRNYS